MESTVVHWGSICIMAKKMQTTIVCWDNGKQNGSYYSMLGSTGIMENRMETITVYWDSIGIMENKNGYYYSVLGESNYATEEAIGAMIIGINSSVPC